MTIRTSSLLPPRLCGKATLISEFGRAGRGIPGRRRQRRPVHCSGSNAVPRDISAQVRTRSRHMVDMGATDFGAVDMVAWPTAGNLVVSPAMLDDLGYLRGQ